MSVALQNDPTDIVARRLLPLLAPFVNDGMLGADVRLLQAWDGRATADSAAAALFEIWIVKHLGRAAVGEVAPDAAKSLIGNGELASVVDLLTGLSDPEARLRILSASLSTAIAELEAALGKDRAQWAWGKLRHVQFDHALQRAAGDRADLSTPRLPGAGSYLTPLAAGWRSTDYRRMTGASFRMVLDVGNWDESRVINGAGQSGDPASPHYRDHFALWATGQYVPLLYLRPAVEAATARILRFIPR